MTKDEALKLALEAFDSMIGRKPERVEQAITAIKEALAQEQGPVAWGVFEGNLHDMFFSPSEAQEMADLKGTHAEVRPLYITPPQRTWVGLTDVEILAVNMSTVTKLIDEPIVCDTDHNIIQLGKAIEAKLKERNT